MNTSMTDAARPPVPDRPRDVGLPGGQPVIGHVIGEYLSSSGMFLHTLFRLQQSFQPVVFAGHISSNIRQFPFSPIVELAPPGHARHRRAARRVRAYAAGHSTAYEHRILRAARELNCAVLHAHWGQMGWSSLPACRYLEIPLITSFYGQDLAAPHRDAVWGRCYTRLFAEGSLFLCEGPAAATKLCELGCPREKLRILRIGLDLSLHPFSIRKRTRPLIVVQTARFVEKKGLDVSIRAFAAARPRIGPSELWLIGDGPCRHELKALATRLGASSFVRFLGLLSHAEFRNALAGAHIGIQPSRVASDGDTEGGAPVSILEMQAVGIPVVGTRHADIPFIVPRPHELSEEEDVEGVAAGLVRLAVAPEGEWRDRALEGRALVELDHDATVTAALSEGFYAEALAAQDARDA